MNNVNLVGRLTKDPTLCRTQNQKNVIRFCIAINEKNTTNFISCIAWEGTATLINKYCKKGDLIAVTGYLNSSTYEDKDGKKIFSLNVVCKEIKFLEKKKDEYPTLEKVIDENTFNDIYTDTHTDTYTYKINDFNDLGDMY